VVSDMKMPGMNGAELLAEVKELAPDTTTMMLTGHADFETAIEAVNEGRIFRFLTKPIQPRALAKAVIDGVKQYNLLRSEQELLNKTLNGSVEVLMELLELADPESFRQSRGVKDLVRKLEREGVFQESWDVEVAASLAQIGFITLPPALLEKYRKGDALNEEESRMLDMLPQVSHDLVVKIPRMESVAEIILYQNKHFNGENYPWNDVSGVDIPQGARVIKILTDLMVLLERDMEPDEALRELAGRKGWYDPKLLEAVSVVLGEDETGAAAVVPQPIPVSVEDLQLGQVIMENVYTESRQMLLSGGQEVTFALLSRIRNWAKFYKIREPIMVLPRRRFWNPDTLRK